ncbi:MAG: dTMP kinase [bacterium]|nr:dTMP kinase [bacterium]
MTQLKKGLLISIEGIDGSGKSTLAHTVTETLTKLGFDVILTKEPGDTFLGKQLRNILQTQPIPIEAKAEYLLFAADRAQHFHEVVFQNLQQNKIVISDRMADSSLVYQGYGRGLDINTLHSINNWAMNGIHPDYTFYVKIPFAIAKERILQRKTTIWDVEKDDTLIKKHIDGFDKLYKNTKKVVPLNGTQQPEILVNQALQKIMQWIEQINT